MTPYELGFKDVWEKWAVFGEPIANPSKRQLPPEAYITPDNPNYDPTTSHYDSEGNWVGDVTAAQAAAYWKSRAR